MQEQWGGQFPLALKKGWSGRKKNNTNPKWIRLSPGGSWDTDGCFTFNVEIVFQVGIFPVCVFFSNTMLPYASGKSVSLDLSYLVRSKSFQFLWLGPCNPNTCRRFQHFWTHSTLLFSGIYSNLSTTIISPYTVGDWVLCMIKFIRFIKSFIPFINFTSILTIFIH